jgi:N-acetylneuraminic acid mutarotase
MKAEKNKLILMLTVYFLSLGSVFSQWVQKTGLPGNLSQRDGAVSWVIGNKSYIVGGNGQSDLLEYDPITDAWTPKTSIPQGVTMFAMGFVANGKGYLCGGNGVNFRYYSSLWEYDPTIDTWTQRADFPTGKRAGGCAFSIDDKGYVGCGDDSSFIYSDFFKYDPTTNSWSALPLFAGGFRTWPYAFSIGNKGYVGGGDQISEMNDLWEFDPAFNSWTQRSSLPGSARQTAVSFSGNSKGYVGLGQSSFTTTYDDVYEYDPIFDSWRQLPSFTPGGRAWATGFSLGNSIYLSTGWNFSTFYKDLYMLDLSTEITDHIVNSANAKFHYNNSNQTLSLEWLNGTATNIRFDIINSMGQLISYSEYKVIPNEINNFKRETSKLSKGLYFLNMYSKEMNQSFKFIVE